MTETPEQELERLRKAAEWWRNVAKDEAMADAFDEKVVQCEMAIRIARAAKPT